MGPLLRTIAGRELLPPRFDLVPLQLGMDRDPWRVTVASMLLCRTRRVQAEPVLRRLLDLWPDAPALARAEGLEDVVRPCGLHRNRARLLQRFSVRYLGDWVDMRELPGVGVYVADAVGLFCFGHTDIESGDLALEEYVCQLRANAPTITPSAVR